MDRRRFLTTLTLGTAAAARPRPASAQAQARRKMAMIMPGPIQDADFNAVGYLALQQVAKTYNLQVSHSEQVVVADAERITREYMSAGYDIIANHGGQFIPIVNKLAPQFRDVTFIQEASGRLPTLPPNLWNIGRRFYQGFYVLGALGAMATKTGKVGMVAGVRLPDVVTSVNSVNQA
ncbi:MAG: BMP family ABC transporter substrate-binding protein, partial [Candidatus Rokuibacteriota bacterium]